MFISVVIPAYNEENYLDRCLRSLREQRYPTSQFEVIVVDNASTDATAEIARRFGARVVSEPVFANALGYWKFAQRVAG